MRALTLIALLTVAVPDREDPFLPKLQALPPLQGEWAMTAWIVNGQPQNPAVLVGRVYTFTDNEMLIRMSNVAKPYPYAITVDIAKQPGTIDIVLKTAKKPAPMKGIFKIEGDTLTICYQRGIGVDRPTEFVAAPNTQAVLWQFKRVQAAPVP
jgi:uncharacterized protein (TIGR03067 family)